MNAANRSEGDSAIGVPPGVSLNGTTDIISGMIVGASLEFGRIVLHADANPSAFSASVLPTGLTVDGSIVSGE